MAAAIVSRCWQQSTMSASNHPSDYPFCQFSSIAAPPPCSPFTPDVRRNRFVFTLAACLSARGIGGTTCSQVFFCGKQAASIHHTSVLRQHAARATPASSDFRQPALPTRLRQRNTRAPPIPLAPWSQISEDRRRLGGISMKAYSSDLRERVLLDCDAGPETRRQMAGPRRTPAGVGPPTARCDARRIGDRLGRRAQSADDFSGAEGAAANVLKKCFTPRSKSARTWRRAGSGGGYHSWACPRNDWSLLTRRARILR